MHDKLLSHQAGQSFIEVLLLIGLIGLVAGGAMLAMGHSVVSGFQASDEAMEASSVGPNQEEQ